jgi:hypothetical protein
MRTIRSPARKLTGLSFSINELSLIRAWAQARSFCMFIKLDHGSESEEFEEAVALYNADSPLCRCILWRDRNCVHLQPMPGRKARFRSVAEAFESLETKQAIVLTDITATSWPR